MLLKSNVCSIFVLLFILGAAFDVKADTIERVVLDEASKYSLLFVRDEVLPVVRLSFAFEGVGSAYDQPEKAGLSMIAMSIFSGTGGAENDSFISDLRKNGIKITSSIEKNAIIVNVTCFTSDFEKASEMLFDRFKKVEFSDTEFTLVSAKQVSAVKSSEKNPDYLALDRLFKMIYRSHPYAHSYYGTIESVQSITREDVQNFFSYAFDSSKMSVSVVGDIDEEVLKNSMLKFFKSLPSDINKNELIQKPTFPYTGENGFISLKVPQTTLYFAKEGLECKNEKYPLFEIANIALGDMSLGSILMSELRGNRALVYGVSTSLFCNKNHGLQLGVARVDQKNVLDALNVIRSVLVSIGTNGLEESIFKRAKGVAVNRQEMRFTDSSLILDFIRNIQLDNLGLDYYENYMKELHGAKLEDVNAIVKSMIKVHKFFFIEVGAHNDFESGNA